MTMLVITIVNYASRAWQLAWCTPDESARQEHASRYELATVEEPNIYGCQPDNAFLRRVEA